MNCIFIPKYTHSQNILIIYNIKLIKITSFEKHLQNHYCGVTNVQKTNRKGCQKDKPISLLKYQVIGPFYDKAALIMAVKCFATHQSPNDMPEYFTKPASIKDHADQSAMQDQCNRVLQCTVK